MIAGIIAATLSLSDLSGGTITCIGHQHLTGKHADGSYEKGFEACPWIVSEFERRWSGPEGQAIQKRQAEDEKERIKHLNDRTAEDRAEIQELAKRRSAK